METLPIDIWRQLCSHFNLQDIKNLLLVSSTVFDSITECVDNFFVSILRLRKHFLQNATQSKDRVPPSFENYTFISNFFPFVFLHCDCLGATISHKPYILSMDKCDKEHLLTSALPLLDRVCFQNKSIIFLNLKQTCNAMDSLLSLWEFRKDHFLYQKLKLPTTDYRNLTVDFSLSTIKIVTQFPLACSVFKIFKNVDPKILNYTIINEPLVFLWKGFSNSPLLNLDVKTPSNFFIWGPTKIYDLIWGQTFWVFETKQHKYFHFTSFNHFNQQNALYFNSKSELLMILKNKTNTFSNGQVHLIKYNFKLDQVSEMSLDFSHLNDSLKNQLGKMNFKMIFIQDDVICLSFYSHPYWYQIPNIDSRWRTVTSQTGMFYRTRNRWEMRETKTSLLNIEEYRLSVLQ